MYQTGESTVERSNVVHLIRCYCWGRSWISSSVCYLAVRYGCSTIIGDDRSGWFLSTPGVSFLSLAWASTVDYEVLHSDGHFRVKDKVLIFSTHLFILSIWLFAVALFTVSYKWWVTTVLILHCTVITICDIVSLCRGRDRNEWEQLWEVLKSFFYWFHRGYEMIFQYKQITSKKETKRNI